MNEKLSVTEAIDCLNNNIGQLTEILVLLSKKVKKIEKMLRKCKYCFYHDSFYFDGCELSERCKTPELEKWKPDL